MRIKQIEKTTSMINGTIIGQDVDFRKYQIQVGHSSLSELKDMCNELEKLDYVKYADYDVVNYYSVNGKKLI